MTVKSNTPCVRCFHRARHVCKLSIFEAEVRLRALAKCCFAAVSFPKLGLFTQVDAKAKVGYKSALFASCNTTRQFKYPTGDFKCRCKIQEWLRNFTMMRPLLRYVKLCILDLRHVKVERPTQPPFTLDFFPDTSVCFCNRFLRRALKILVMSDIAMT